MPDRTQVPALAPLQQRSFPEIHRHKLRNGIQALLIPFGTEPVVELQLVYPYGAAQEELPGLNALTCKLWKQGTERYTALQLAETLDQYGADIDVEGGLEATTLTLSTLSRHLEATLDILAETALHPTFPEDEFRLQVDRLQQQLAVQAQRTNWQARYRGLAELYPGGHPYGRILTTENLAALSRDALPDYFAQVLHPQQAFIVVSGQFDGHEMLHLLDSHFGQLAPHTPAERDTPALPVPSGKQAVHTMPGNGQSTLVLGHAGVARSHPDFYKLQLLNLALGGYFGSRLMQNIREDKGYTYGIGSAWRSYRTGGHWVTSTDVANEYVPDTLVQIQAEMKRLQDEHIPTDELEMARNYGLGRQLAGLETPDQVVQKVAHWSLNGLDEQEALRAWQAYEQTSAQELLELAQKHFQPESLSGAICGGYSPQG